MIAVRSDCPEIVWISSKMDDKIIYAWCGYHLNFIECFDSTSSATIILLVKKFGEIFDSSNRWGRQLHTNSCQNIVKTYQFNENNSN